MFLLSKNKAKLYLSSLYKGTNPIPRGMDKRPCIYGFTFAERARLKIGVSRNLKSRMRDHSTLAPDFKLEFVIYFDTIEEAEQAEKDTLKEAELYYKRILDSEVFELMASPTYIELKRILKQFIDFETIDIVKGETDLIIIPSFPIK